MFILNYIINTLAFKMNFWVFYKYCCRFLKIKPVELKLNLVRTGVTLVTLLTNLSSIPIWACTGKLVDKIRTGASVLTRIAGTFIDICRKEQAAYMGYVHIKNFTALKNTSMTCSWKLLYFLKVHFVILTCYPDGIYILLVKKIPSHKSCHTLL